MRVSRPGADGEPLPDGAWVFRLSAVPKDFHETGKINEAAFDLSDADKRAAVPRLSVWTEDLTSPEQARGMLTNPARYELVLRLGVDEVRSLRPAPDAPQTPTLDVQWERRVTIDADGQAVPDTSPGAEGHAGITGLSRQSGEPRRRVASLKYELVKLVMANDDCVVRLPTLSASD